MIYVDFFCRIARRSAGGQADALSVLSRQVSGHVRKELHTVDLVAVPYLRKNVDARHRRARATMVVRPATFNSYEFVLIAASRAKQLLSGCVPLVPGDHSAAIAAQMEVAEGRVVRCAAGVSETPRKCLWQL